MSSKASHGDNVSCDRFLGMVERGKAMEIRIDANILVKQTRREDGSILCLKGNSSCLISNVQLVVVNCRYD